MAEKLARVLSIFFDAENQLNPNDLASGTADIIKIFEDAGVVDSNKAAVDYCKSENAKVIKVLGKGIATNEETAALKADEAAAATAEAIAKATEAATAEAALSAE